MVDIVGFHAIQISPFWKPLPILTETILPRGVIFNIKPESQQHWRAASMHVKQVVSLMVNQHGPLPFTKNQSTDKTGWWRNPGGCWAYLPISDHYRWPLQGADLSEKRWFGFNYSSELTLPEAVTQKCMWHPCESGRFSYGESLRTPPWVKQ